MMQWNKFVSGTRGYHPEDDGGAKMRKAVVYLESEKDATDVIAYIATLAEKFPEGRKSKAPAP